MSYGEIDQLAINTIRLLAVSFILSWPESTPPKFHLPRHKPGHDSNLLLS